MKKTNKKILKFITLIILLISTAALGTVVEDLFLGSTARDIRTSDITTNSNISSAKNFFESNAFENSTFQMILSDMEVATSSTQRYPKEDILDARNSLYELRDIKFFATNNSTGISYTNTNFGSNDEFRKYQKIFAI
ncbi:hypothetical protein QJS64_07470 [Paraclostridium bifermentans]|uniref:Uncharacterized protein n=1 Tax=Paraclostridium bifermentans TaxID=1490 RepID=A0ABY8R5N5_PARBF|nr:hypothetical protein QJS64_07470 [Paraclostridium bifermentans]